MAHVFRIAEKSFLKRFYSCLLMPLSLQILSIYLSILCQNYLPLFSDFYLPSSNSFAASTGFELCYASKWKCGLSKYQSPFLMLDACYCPLVGFFLAALSIGL